MKISIARRIKGSMIGLTLVLCLVFTGMAMMMVYVTEDQVFVNLLRNEQVQFEQLSETQRNDWQPSHRQMQLYSGEKELPIKLQNIMGEKPGVYEYFDGDHAMFVLSGHLKDTEAAYFIGFDVSALLVVRSSRYDLLLSISIVSMILILISVLIAYRLAQQTLAPLKKLTTQLQDENAELPKGFAVDFYGDEVGVLAKQLERSIELAQSAAQREFEFNRGVSHELRSPIQVAQNATELLELNTTDSQFNRTAVVNRLKRSIEQMKLITEAFLWLATDGGQETKLTGIDECMELLKAKYAQSHPSFMIDVVYGERSDHLIKAPAAVLMVLMDSFTRNALQHGTKESVKFVFNEAEIHVENNVIDGEQSVEQSGYGIGLVIAKRLCEQLGWNMTVDAESKNLFCIKILLTY